jgi:hypothetical protein
MMLVQLSVVGQRFDAVRGVLAGATATEVPAALDLSRHRLQADNPCAEFGCTVWRMPSMPPSLISKTRLRELNALPVPESHEATAVWTSRPAGYEGWLSG